MTSRIRRLNTLALALSLGLLIAGWVGPTLAQTAASQPGLVQIDLATTRAKSLTLPQGRSALIELSQEARDLLISNPTAVDAVLRTPRRIYVLGLKSGQSDVVITDAVGRRLLTLDIRVDRDTAALTQTLVRLLPGAKVKVEGLNDNIVLSGTVANLAEAGQVLQIAQKFVGKPEQVVNLLTIAGKDQVMLKVRIVEMQRSVIKQLGVNLSAVINQAGQPQYMLGKTVSWGVNGALQGGLTGGYDFNSVTGSNPTGKSGWNKAQSKLQAFERAGLIRTLAEPTLTAVSGESAKFLAGGEYPVPTGQDSTGKVSVEFKPYGVGLGFTPMVLSGGRIALKLSTEVSELSNDGAFTLSSGAGTAGLTINALTVNRVESSIELPSGGSLMIAGLLKEKTRQAIDSIPGMSNMPVLGPLFRSRDFLSGQTELVVIVTPYIVDSARPDQLQTPDAGIQIASDAQAYLLGRMNRVQRARAGAGAKGGPAEGQTFVGPFGYVVD